MNIVREIRKLCVWHAYTFAVFVDFLPVRAVEMCAINSKFLFGHLSCHTVITVVVYRCSVVIICDAVRSLISWIEPLNASSRSATLMRTLATPSRPPFRHTVAPPIVTGMVESGFFPFQMKCWWENKRAFDWTSRLARCWRPHMGSSGTRCTFNSKALLAISKFN